MALRIPWDIEEAVLMLDMLLKSFASQIFRWKTYTKRGNSSSL